MIIFIFITVGLRESDAPWYVGKWSGVNTYSVPNYTLGIQISDDNSVTGCVVEPGVLEIKTYAGVIINDGKEIQWGDGTSQGFKS